MKEKDCENVRYKIEDKVFSYMAKHQMAAPGDNVVVGCSGGADSVCLLFLLLEYSKKVPLKLAVVHVNHFVRPDAGEDARYVENLCRERDIPFYLTETDVKEFAGREKCSEEDAGRRVRYKAFRRAAAGLGGAKIAVAHNMDDSAETLLLHLFRGSGSGGLCGIAPVRDGIIRPILCLDRREVEAYLTERGIVWRSDSTNDGDDYCRNRIRHHVLPYAESSVARGAAGHICRAAEILSETEDYLRQQTEAALSQCVDRGEPWAAGGVELCGYGEERAKEIFGRRAGRAERYTVHIDRFLEFHMALQKRMLLSLAEELSPTGKDISAVHVEDMLSLFERPGNREISLPFGIRAKRRYGVVMLERSADKGARAERAGRESPDQPGDGGGRETKLPPLEPGQSAALELAGGMRLELCINFYEKGQEVPRNQYTKWLDYDKITESPVIRFRRKGDYLTIADRDRGLVHKTLKDYMITEKIPRELRERIPVLAAGSHVLWLAGYRISEYFKVSGNTRHVLQVKLVRNCSGDETEEKNVGTH